MTHECDQFYGIQSMRSYSGSETGRTIPTFALPLTAINDPHLLAADAADTEITPGSFGRDTPIHSDEAFLTPLASRVSHKCAVLYQTHLVQGMSTLRHDMRLLSRQSEGEAQTLDAHRTEIIIDLILGGDQRDLVSGDENGRGHAVGLREVGMEA